MRILFIADGRSPTALNWIGYYAAKGDEVHLVSTFPAEPEIPLASLHILPVAFGRAAGARPQGSQSAKTRLLKRFLPTGLRTRLRQWLGPLTLPKAAKRLTQIIQEVDPDIVHALRIPYEGMLAGLAKSDKPLVVSVWGNDFTLHASTSPLMKRYTRRTLERANALLSDCQRDIRLAKAWGFDESKPHKVLPGGGGLQLDVFYPPQTPVSEPIVINPRGLRAYVRNDMFFKAIPLVLNEIPEARFICTTMQGEAQAEGWVQAYGLENKVDLLPFRSREEMADLFRQASVVVSPSEHDGTPNSLLEAMACGCFPVAGDIESIREWIRHQENGLLADPGNAEELAQSIIKGLKNTELRQQAREINLGLVKEKAEYQTVMEMSETFYQNL